MCESGWEEDFRCEQLIEQARRDERERCAKIAEKYVERTNSDIAHAIVNEIREVSKADA